MTDPNQEYESWEMPKYPSLKYPNHESVTGLLEGETEILVQEKFDGANFRFRPTKDGIVYGSRNMLFHEDGEPLPRDEITEAFRHATEYVDRVIDRDAFTELQDYAFYGEALHRHTLDYDAWEGEHPDPTSDHVPNVIIFDAYDFEANEFVSHGELIRLKDELGMNDIFLNVELIDAEELTDDDFEIPHSIFRAGDDDAETEFDAKGLAEGVVLRNLDTGARAKLVHERFKEKHRGNPKFDDGGNYQPTDADRFVDTYVPRARIEKTIHKLIDDGSYGGMKMEMMEDLPRRVIVDAVEENAWELMTNDLDLDDDMKGEIRSKVSSKCASVLKSELQSL